MQDVILDSTKKLQIQLDALKATNECDVTVSYADTNGNILVGDGAQESRSNGVTLQDILAAPVNPNIRNALTITVVNNDTIQHTVYIYKVTGAGNYLVTEQILAVGASWDSNLNNNIVTPTGGSGGGGGGDFAVADGRLTLTSGTPVTTPDVTGATNIYYTPYKGTKIGLFDGSSTWNILTFAETSLPLGTLTSGLTYDLFAYNNSGTLALEFSAWSNATTRATALVYQNGILVKSGATTRRYLGTFYTTSSTTTEDSASKRFVWNYYNRVLRYAYIADTADSHSYTVAAWRIWNNNTANKIQFVVGVQEDALSNYIYATTSGAVGQWAGTELNGTAFSYGGGTQISSQNSAIVALQAFFVASPATISLGYNYIAAIELGIANGTSVNFYMWATILG